MTLQEKLEKQDAEIERLKHHIRIMNQMLNNLIASNEKLEDLLNNIGK